jgi:hypothetical protein
MIYELRIYRLHRTKKEGFLRGFRKSTTFMQKYGITLVGAWENKDRDEFVWLRSFPSLEAREKAIRAFYDSPEWLAIVELLRSAIRRREVRLMKSLPPDR